MWGSLAPIFSNTFDDSRCVFKRVYCPKMLQFTNSYLQSIPSLKRSDSKLQWGSDSPSSLDPPEDLQSDLTVTLCCECSSHSKQSCFIQEEESPFLGLRTSLLWVRQIVFQLHENWVWVPLFKFPVLRFVINWDFCLFSFSSLQRKSSTADVFMVGYIWWSKGNKLRKFKRCLLRWAQTQKIPPLSNKVENTMLEQKMQEETQNWSFFNTSS